MPGNTQSLPSTRTTGYRERVRAMSRDIKGTDHRDIGGDKQDLCVVWEECHALAGNALSFVSLESRGTDTEISAGCELGDESVRVVAHRRGWDRCRR